MGYNFGLKTIDIFLAGQVMDIKENKARADFFWKNDYRLSLGVCD